MNLGETDPTKLRIPITILDEFGALVTGFVPGAGELVTSKGGAAFAAAAGSLVEIGAGAYYYQGVAADADTEGYTAAAINRATYRGFSWRPVVGPTGVLAFPFFITSGGLLATGCNPSGAGELQMSLDGASYVAATGTFTELGLGYYAYTHDVDGVLTPVIVKVNKAGFDVALAWGSVDSTLGAPPAITSIAPAPNLAPGAAGAFSAVFAQARLTPLVLTLVGIPGGCAVAITAKFATRDETIVALDFGGAWCWPFDVVGPDNNNIGALTSEPVTVQLLPRGGWPPGRFTIEVAAAAKASSP